MAKFQTLVEALQHWAEEKPHSSAIVFRDRHHQRHSLTWSQLYTLSGRFAAVLRTHAIARGALVLNTLPNAMDRVVCEAGIWMSGAASVNGRYLQSDGSDLLSIIRLSGCPVIVVDPDIEDGPWCVLKKCITLDDNDVDVVSSTLPCVRKVLFVRRVENGGPGDFLGGLQTQTQWFQAGDIAPDDVLSVFATSGTTGFSKLVIHSHQSLIGYLVDSVYAESFLKQPLQFNLTPLGWIGGSLPLFIVPGVTRVACDVRAGMPEDMPRFIWRTIQEEKCRSARFSPAYMPGVVKLAEEESQKSNPDSGQPPYWKVTTILLSGIPVNRPMVEAALTLAHKACVLYGATDAGTVAANIVTDSARFLDYDAGKPFKGIQVKIVHPRNEEEEIPRNQVGDILVKTPHVMKGYLNDPEATAAAFTQDGFFRTGDVGRMDERGHLFSEGRGSDAIMRDDFVFHPSWMEQRVREFPGVAAVTIVGVPDPFLNEELCACVVLASDDVSLEDVRHFVENVVAPYSPSSPTPRYYLSFQSFPQTDTGKPRRKEIKLQAAQRLGLSLTKH